MHCITILTCGPVAVVTACEAPEQPTSGDPQATAVLNITMVMLTFQIVRTPPEPPRGLAWWPDFGSELAIPHLTLLWRPPWWARPLRLAHLPLRLRWPIG